MKVVTEWFGHDMATALKHYHQSGGTVQREMVTQKILQASIAIRPKLFANSSRARLLWCVSSRPQVLRV